jgi:antitoxin HicB
MQKGTKKISSKKPLRSSRNLPSVDDYQMVLLWSEADSCYVVTLPAWQNAQTHGKTPAAAIKNGREALELLIESAAKNGEPIPAPERRHSGNLRLRLPVSLHGRLVLEAEREGVSLNQWIVSKLAQ